MKLTIILGIVALGREAHAQLNRKYKIDPTRVQANAVTTPIGDKTAFGTCACDRT
jgi:hypothetical protein